MVRIRGSHIYKHGCCWYVITHIMLLINTNMRFTTTYFQSLGPKYLFSLSLLANWSPLHPHANFCKPKGFLLSYIWPWTLPAFHTVSFGAQNWLNFNLISIFRCILMTIPWYHVWADKKRQMQCNEPFRGNQDFLGVVCSSSSCYWANLFPVILAVSSLDSPQQSRIHCGAQDFPCG